MTGSTYEFEWNQSGFTYEEKTGTPVSLSGSSILIDQDSRSGPTDIPSKLTGDPVRPNGSSVQNERFAPAHIIRTYFPQ